MATCLGAWEKYVLQKLLHLYSILMTYFYNSLVFKK
jgi:hypothetical protein